MADYWALRQAEAQEKRTATNIKDTEKQLKTYYTDAMHSAMRDFEDTLLHLQARAEDGKVTPADLYKMDKYWATIAQLNFTMKELGDKQAQVLAENFMKEWQEVYESTAATSQSSFKTANTDIAEQMINSVWCADGKSWSERIWGNTEALKAALNEGLIECVVTGKKASDLKKRLQNEFGASYRQADMLVRTEMQHIQTIAAKQRYEDDGITKYEFIGNEKEHGCHHSPSCSDLDGQIFFMKDMKVGKNAPPIHPRCRCSISAVVDIDEVKENTMEEPKGISEERRQELLEAAKHIAKPRDFAKFKEEKGLEYAISYARREATRQSLFKEEVEVDRGNKAVFLAQLDRAGKKNVNSNKKRQLREMVADWPDSMFGICQDCGMAFIKDNPKSNAAKRCPECQAEYRKQYKAEKKKEENAKLKRKRYKAKWARENRAKKK